MTTTLTTFFCEYSILSEHSTRDTCLTLFGGMTQEDDLRDLGDVKLLGRWACVGEARGFCIVQAASNYEVQKWLNSWVSMADIKVVPCLDDNQHRELILGNESLPFRVSYDAVFNHAKEGESLYFVKYQFKEGLRDKGFEAFSSLTEEQDKADPGKATPYGRWHVPSQGCGYAIASSPSAFDMYKWAYNWNALCDVSIHSVTHDDETREIIKSSLGYEIKHAKLVEQLKELQPKSGPCYVHAKMNFKTKEFKEEFKKLLHGEEGLKVTRAWPGCQFIECYESQEDECEFTIRQKWDNESDHASYLEMRKSTDLFASIMEKLDKPFEITHLNSLEC